MQLPGSPLPCTRGRGAGGEGDWPLLQPGPLTPTLSPEYRGEGEHCAPRSITGVFSPFFRSEHNRGRPPWYPPRQSVGGGVVGMPKWGETPHPLPARALAAGWRVVRVSLGGLTPPARRVCQGSVHHFHLPRKAAGQLGAVRHHHQDRLLLPVQVEQHLPDRLGRVAVEVAGRLVGEQQDGCCTRARATATRCRSPPDSSAGR